MKRLLLSALLCAVALPSSAQTTAAPAAPAYDDVKKLVETNMGFVPETVTRFDMGMYEVTVGRQILYVDKDVRFVFQGNLFDVKTRENLTGTRHEMLSMIDPTTLPTQLALKFVEGKGERVLHVFSDPQCEGCRRLTQSLLKMENVTVYTYVTPIMESEDLAKRILCDKDPAKAWKEWMLDKKEPASDGKCANDTAAKNLKLAQHLDITTVPTIFFPDGIRHEGSMNKMQLEAKFAPPCPIEHMHENDPEHQRKKRLYQHQPKKVEYIP
ncbi:MAG: DsbC family protein [Duodenibacillus sp.]|nr:DsbC family protein [Duodenibacillus sp.]